MKNRKPVFFALAAFFAPLWSGTANAAVMTYNIDVRVTAAPLAPGSFTENQWSIPSTPVTYHGTFMADDTNIGAISNLNLTIGGVDIASSHIGLHANSFDPGTLQLNYNVSNWDYPSYIAFGQPMGFMLPPANYAVAFDAVAFSPIEDPYYGAAQNWVGTVSITQAVPEPSTVLLLGIGVLGMAYKSRRKAAAQA